jgi:general secretion pathway protein J
MTHPRRLHGFTLIEVMVSVFLLAILSGFAYETLSYVTRTRDGMLAVFERTKTIDSAVHLLTTDFEQLSPRPVRDLLGAATEPALLADGSGSRLVTLTRAGWSNPIGAPRGTFQRVTYRLEGGVLMREYLPVLDATLGTQPVKRAILGDVVSARLRFMDASHAWRDQWPALGIGSGSVPGGLPTATRPIAVEITLRLKDLGTIVRLVEVPG